MSLKTKSADYYFEKFNEFINSGQPIRNSKTGEELVLQDGEEFRQCYADTPRRRDFPKFWFVSEHHLISVCEKKLAWTPKNIREDGRPYYMFTLYDEQGNKTQAKSIEAHNLIGLVFESESFGKATKQLEEHGVCAFGVNGTGKTQGHHKDGNHNNNKAENIKFTTDPVHNLLEHAPEFNGDAEKQEKWLIKFADLMSKENPDSPTILFTGQHGTSIDNLTFEGGIKDIIALDSSTSKETLDKIARMQFIVVNAWIEEDWSEMMKTVYRHILETKGIQFFYRDIIVCLIGEHGNGAYFKISENGQKCTRIEYPKDINKFDVYCEGEKVYLKSEISPKQQAV